MKKIQDSKRILARRVAKTLDTQELKATAGGRTTCSGGCADDCGYPMIEEAQI
jgi:hypothetical protein